METPDDEFDTQLKEKVNKEALDPKSELKLKRETLLKIEKIMKISKGSKSTEDLIFLFNYFVNFKFFSTGIQLYGKNTMINLLDCSNFKELAANDIIINLGDNVGSAYILISGNIKVSSLRIGNENNEKDKVRFKTSEKINKILNIFLYNLLKSIQGNIQYNIQQIIDKLHANNIRFSKPNHKKIFNIEDEWYVRIGEMFGEKYLIERKSR